jgi:hypothetical protein
MSDGGEATSATTAAAPVVRIASYHRRPIDPVMESDLDPVVVD